MQILLLEPDLERQIRWQVRLQTPEITVNVVSTAEDAIKLVSRVHCALAICDYRDNSCGWHDNVGNTVARLRTGCQSVFCIVGERDQTTIEMAFQMGFDDYFLDDCGDGEILAKVNRAEQIEKLNQRLAQAQKLESIGELAAGIAHEINTPIQYVGDNTRFVQTACGDLTGVLECCQKLVSAEPSSIASTTATLRSLMTEADVDYLLEEIPFAITQTLEGVNRVANIVRAMKEFAHPGVSEMTMCDLSKSIENTVMVARNEWKYVADLETRFDPNLPMVPCLPGELNQVLLNMIVNASHAIADTLGESPEQKGKIMIITKLAAPHAEIRIADSGSGMPKEIIERIFTQFFTTKAAGKGTGQGLAIAQSVVVEKHGGTIEVESELGKGTTFVIRLPLQVQAAADQAVLEKEEALMSV